MKFGERLRAAREHAGLTQKQLEARSGVSQKTISKIERGDQDASTQVAQLARACGIDTEWLATGEGSMLQNKAREPGAEYAKLSQEAIDIAVAWQRLSPSRRETFRDLLYMLVLGERRFPWLLRGRPKSETYVEWERRQEQNFSALAVLERDRDR